MRERECVFEHYASSTANSVCRGGSGGELLAVVAADLTLPALRALVMEALPLCNNDYKSVTHTITFCLVRTQVISVRTIDSIVSKSLTSAFVLCVCVCVCAQLLLAG